MRVIININLPLFRTKIRLRKVNFERRDRSLKNTSPLLWSETRQSSPECHCQLPPRCGSLRSGQHTGTRRHRPGSKGRSWRGRGGEYPTVARPAHKSKSTWARMLRWGQVHHHTHEVPWCGRLRSHQCERPRAAERYSYQDRKFNLWSLLQMVIAELWKELV